MNPSSLPRPNARPASELDKVIRLAMWSGPRNISTALMRSFENRPDTLVCDEPLYAHYLVKTGKEHPGRKETLASQDHDWREVVARLLQPMPPYVRIYYQKHMAHHLLPDVERDWLQPMRHAFLIRDPQEMLISLAKHLPQPTLEDTGLPQQVELFQRVRDWTDHVPIVLDARDILMQPEAMLTLFCQVLGVEFLPSMLHWPPGSRTTDGAWAPYWYQEVWQTTGFAPYRRRDAQLSAELQPLWDTCQPLYHHLYQWRLVPRDDDDCPPNIPG